MIGIIDLKLRYLEKKELNKIFNSVLKKGNLVLTDEVKEFENNICKFTKSKYCVGLNSGTDALMLSLMMNGVKRGDEVITTPISFIATLGAITHIGAIPIFVDVGDDLNINPDLIEKAITNKTKAIVPVHWGGKICQMDKISKIAKKYKIKIIEDAAQALGSYYRGKHAGTFGDIASFSTHPLKNLSALGDGGFIITSKKSIFDKVKLFRNHGLKGRDNSIIFGLNSRLDSLSAKVLSFRLRKLNSIINKRRKNVELYKKYLKTTKVKIFQENHNHENTYVMFLLECNSRNKLQKYLQKNKIQSLVYYGKPLHQHPATKKLKLKKFKLPKAENICKKVLALPIHQYLKESHIKLICKHINYFYK